METHDLVPMSRAALLHFTRMIRRKLGISPTEPFVDIMRILEHVLPQLFPDFTLEILPREDMGGNPTSFLEWCERRPKSHHPSLPAGMDQRKLSGQSGLSPVPSGNKATFTSVSLEDHTGGARGLAPPPRNRRNLSPQRSEESILLPS